MHFSLSSSFTPICVKNSGLLGGLLHPIILPTPLNSSSPTVRLDKVANLILFEGKTKPSTYNI